MLWGSYPWLSACSRAGEPQLLSLHTATTETHASNTRALLQEKPRQWETHMQQLESNPCLPQLEKKPTQTQHSQN